MGALMSSIPRKIYGLPSPGGTAYDLEGQILPSAPGITPAASCYATGCCRPTSSAVQTRLPMPESPPGAPAAKSGSSDF